MNDFIFLFVRMSEKEKCEAKEQLKLLHQAHGELSQMSVNQTPAAEQVREMKSFFCNYMSDKLSSVHG